MSEPAQTICLTPTRNEGWIIDKFLSAASQWADHIIVADQHSTDDTVEQIRRTPGALLVINDSTAFNEPDRQRILIEHARHILGKRILIALDADEALSANAVHSPEWKRLRDAEPGTIVRFPWVNILPGFERAWIPPGLIPCGYVDDGKEHVGTPIHSPRVPYSPAGPFLDCHDIVVLHFQYVAWNRMASKHRWYQAWEHVTHRQKGALRIFREYHHMYGSWDESEMHRVDPAWFDGYSQRGIDFQSLRSEAVTWWDVEVLKMLEQHGPDLFRKIDIWDKDWEAVAAVSGNTWRDLSDPRSVFDKVAHWTLAATQRDRTSVCARVVERMLSMTGW